MSGALAKLLRRASGKQDLAPYLIGRADAARDAGRFGDAAVLYEEVLPLRPDAGGLAIQAGHMRKEVGDLPRAGEHYRAALALMPDDADLAIQLGHYYKACGRFSQAEAEYRRAATLKPDWGEPMRELEGLRESGWSGDIGFDPTVPINGADWIEPAFRDHLPRFDEQAATLARAGTISQLIPDLVPRPEQMVSYREGIEIRRLGRREPGYWGLRRTLRGVEAIRGFAISETPVLDATVLLNGMVIHRASVTGGYALDRPEGSDRYRKYVFNLWLDFSRFAFGFHAIEVRLALADGSNRTFHDRVVIAEPVAEADYPDSDALVTIDADDPRGIEEQIKTRPSVVHDAKRDVFPDGVRTVLVLRTDQLGDMVSSIPAMRRLRELVPDARIVGLLTAANADLARTLALFDEVIVVDFPDDPVERRRLMPFAAQEELRRRLEPYRFDLALDLAQSAVSREVLRLAGARFTYGVEGRDWPWLSTEFMFNSHDRWSGHDVVPHSAKVLAMIEALGAILQTHAPIVRRDDLAPDMLAEYGIAAGERFIVLHMGARIVFSRWPHYAALAALLLERTDLKIVLMTEDLAVRPTMPAALLGSDRVIYLDRRLPFDHFDAFLSFATVLVGNDSGPKHLASLRGTNVVTLWTGRINWQEWGQENVGAIVGRRVPCQGCNIFHDAEECGQGFTCIRDIRPQEVLETVLRYV